jgi:signal transduction histidine kinase
VFTAWTQDEPPLADPESRIAEFTGLVATAIANAESRAEVTRLLEEQAALRRVATLVARGVSPVEVFGAVTAEAGRLLGADATSMLRYEPGGTAVVVAADGKPGVEIPVGTRLTLEGESATASVFRTRRTVWTDAIEGPPDSAGAFGHGLGMHTALGAPVVVEGRLWGTIIAAWARQEPNSAEIEARMTQFSGLAATAIANAESRAELTASRARVVAATAEERRRVVRDLHDGAQQRLVHAVIMLKLALRGLGTGDRHAEDFVTEALDHAEQANSELRELVHGILPGVLTSGGLHAGVEELASRTSLPVTVDVATERFPSAIEATAYFVVSEALTNVVKHARAQAAEVGAHVENGVLRVEVFDDGGGGADPARGSGLTGLRDRVEALGGTLEITSPTGRGTSLLVEIPIEGG